MIPSNIIQADILKAIEKILQDDYPDNREADDYEMVYDRRAYPPKVVVSYSNLFANGSELAASEFNAREARRFLMAKGFPIRSTLEKNPDHFFTEEELDFFQQFADQPYDASDPVMRNAGNFIRSIHDKTKRWANLIANRLSYAVSGRAQWNDRGKRGHSNQRIRHYTWYKLHDPSNSQELVYYTVGISGGDKTMLIKIDCQRSGTNALQPQQVELCDTFLKERKIKPFPFIASELSSMNWETLVERSTKYISQTLSAFQTLVAIIATTPKEMCARICWNTEGWVKPSGRAGKSRTSKQSAEHIQERDNGFGPEEWLFDLDKLIHGYHYARIEPLNSAHHIGKPYNITLFSNNSIESNWYWIGKIVDVQVITKEESQATSDAYRKNGWLQEQLDQLSALDGVNAASYEKLADDQRFNLKFRPENVTLFEILPFQTGEKVPSTHYNLANKVKNPQLFEPAIMRGIMLNPRKGRKSKSILIKRHSENYKELRNIHGDIQDNLAVALRDNFPNIEFFPEAIKVGVNSRVDMVGQKPDGSFIFFEVKSYPAVLQSIRVAVGQLLEYSLYPDQHLASEFYIVTHLPATSLDLSFLHHLSSCIRMKFGYIHFNLDTKYCTLSE
ncbi:MAG TPA: hypothetical protein VHE34_10605 [Puia sp.]|uniref:hypothetical protein n=1 Tax=Puia sp. TaxID=2045100 RepID=UPI002CF8D42A|nr:hypothetical protein [Puia sp.]HVU95667.1 hypothetical protein [Puia sp.]